MDYDKLADKLFRTISKHRFTHISRDITSIVRGEHFTLGMIYMNHSLLPGEIAAEMQASTAYVAKMLRGLEEKGLIIRTQDEDDRRRTLITLTVAGKEKAETDINFIRLHTRKMLEKLGDKDAADFVRILGRLINEHDMFDCPPEDELPQS